MSAEVGTGRVFSSRYNRVLLTPGYSIYLSALLVVPAAVIFKNIAAGFAIAFATMVVSTWILTVRRRQRPALLLSDEGMQIENLPVIAWREIVSVRRDPDTRTEPWLIVRLRGEPKVRGNMITPAPLWSYPQDGTIRLRLSLLEDAPQDIEAAFKAFLKPN